MSGLSRATGAFGRFLLRMVLLVVVPVVALAVGLYLYAESGRHVTTENAYIKSNVVLISSDVSGRVEWVGVEDNAPVRKGQVLFRLDQRPFRIELDRSGAELALARAQVEQLRAGYHEALARVAEEEENVKFLARRLSERRPSGQPPSEQRPSEQRPSEQPPSEQRPSGQRPSELPSSERRRSGPGEAMDLGLGGKEAFEPVAHDLSLARQRVRALRWRAWRALQSLGGAPDTPVEAHARFLQARAERDQAAVALARTQVKAPVDGVVSNMKLQAGEHVAAGEAVFSVVELGKVWVEANLKETQLTHVLEGQSATVAVDAYPGVEWRATVDAIAPATGAEFSVLPPQNATGNWVKVVQRIPVLLEVERPPDGSPLRAGMTVTVSIDTERERTMPAVLRTWFDDDLLARVRSLGRSLREPAGFLSSARAEGGGQAFLSVRTRPRHPP